MKNKINHVKKYFSQVETIAGKNTRFQSPSRVVDEIEWLIKEYKANNTNPTPNMLKIESSRLQRADTIIAVISSTREHPKIPEWEQVLSAGAVCTTILYAAQSLGYAAQWITEWYAYNTYIISELGGNPEWICQTGLLYF